MEAAIRVRGLGCRGQGLGFGVEGLDWVNPDPFVVGFWFRVRGRGLKMNGSRHVELGEI